MKQLWLAVQVVGAIGGILYLVDRLDDAYRDRGPVVREMKTY